MPTPEEPNLPPLPRAGGFVIDMGGEDGQSISDWEEPISDGAEVYTAWQMLAFGAECRRMALEDAARACERRVMGDNNREDQEAARCAAAIRAIYGNGSEGGGSSLGDGFDGSQVRAGPNHSTIEIWYDTEEQAMAAHKAILDLIDP